MNKLQEARTIFDFKEELSCDCWKCSNCGEMFDGKMDKPANKELNLCIYCENERIHMEVMQCTLF